jgi:hypothetical protein
MRYGKMMNTEKIKALTDKELRIKMAEFCGYKWYKMLAWNFEQTAYNREVVYFSYLPEKWDAECNKGTVSEVWLLSRSEAEKMINNGNEFIFNAPDYCNDLNVIQREEKKLYGDKWIIYTEYICNITGSPFGATRLTPGVVDVAITAKARQKVEAFILTMETK